MSDQSADQRVSGDHNIFTATGDVHVYKSPPALSPAEAKEKRELNILLRRVKQFWIEGVLEKSVINIALIDLGKETQAQAVTHAWEQILELPDQTRQTVPPNKKIGQLFEEMNRSLLILGEPGSGKTITLLQLASELTKTAENDENYGQPIPVIFNLSTWTGKQQSLFDWMIAELSSKYQIPKSNSRKWLGDNRLLPLLDGLDEVDPDNRAACVEAINKFGEEYGLSGLAVCSRLEEYTNLPVRLRLNGAIRLLPLTLEQVYEALDSAGEKLEGIKRVLHIDENLQTLAKSPLFFGIMLLAYQDRTMEKEEKLPDHVQEPLAVRRQNLFDTYIDFMLKRKRASERPYDDQKTKNLLTWLAQQMLQKRQSIFLIEQIQPDWLFSNFLKGVYLMVTRLIGGAIIGLIVGIVPGLGVGLPSAFMGGIVVGLIDIYRSTKLETGSRTETNGFWSPIISTFTVGLSVWFVIWLLDSLMGFYFEGFLFGLVFGTVFGITFGIGDKQRLSKLDIRTVEALGWRWSRAIRYGGLGLIAGVIFGLAAEFVYRVSFGLKIASRSDWWLGTSTLVATAVAISGFIFGGLQNSLIEMKTHPNQGIRLSLRNGAYAGSIAGVIIGVLGGLLGNYFVDLLHTFSGGIIAWPGGGFRGGILSGLAGGLMVSFWYGWFDVLKHYTLRSILYLRGLVPFSLAQFLNYGVDRIFLQRVGGGYIFIHRLLLEHFAEMNTPK
jgi:eukaryotic-like serine/threonine-protein kinase